MSESFAAGDAVGDDVDDDGPDGLVYASDTLHPRLVVGGAHVDAGQVRCGAFDAVRHGAGQLPSSVLSLEHQRTAAVSLRWEYRNEISQFASYNCFRRQASEWKDHSLDATYVQS